MQKSCFGDQRFGPNCHFADWRIGPRSLTDPETPCEKNEHFLFLLLGGEEGEGEEDDTNNEAEARSHFLERLLSWEEAAGFVTH